MITYFFRTRFLQYNDHKGVTIERHTAQTARTLPLLEDAHDDGHRGRANGSHAITLQQQKSHMTFSTITDMRWETGRERDRADR